MSGSRKIASAEPTGRPRPARAAQPTGGFVPTQAPAMQVVTKGWWVLRDERATVEELIRQDHDHR